MRSKNVRNAIYIGVLCSVSYLGVYFARNILSAVTPQILENGIFTTEEIGTLSSLFFIAYGVGQLINGVVGDKIKAKYMISLGLMLSGICNFVFPLMSDLVLGAYITYGMTGFFLSMIFAPISKVVAENTEPIYATRCSLGYTFASFLGSPLAGVAAAVFVWQTVFRISSVILVIMGAICFFFFFYFEKKGIVKYNKYESQVKRGNGIQVLVQNRIIRFTLIAIITGIVRTTVVFWMPTYISQYLGFSSKKAATAFTIASFVISMSAFIAVFIYERLKSNLDLTNLVVFISAACFFLLVYFVEEPLLNMVFLVLAILSSNCADAMLWSRYCPSIRDTGMVSTATGFLDFASYMAAAVSTTLFGNAVISIGWKNLILIWFGFMVFGIIINWRRVE